MILSALLVVMFFAVAFWPGDGKPMTESRKAFLVRQLDSENALRRRLWLIMVVPGCMVFAVAAALLSTLKSVIRGISDGDWGIISDVWDGMKHTWSAPITHLRHASDNEPRTGHTGPNHCADPRR